MDIQAVFFDMGGTLETVWYTPEQRLQADLWPEGNVFFPPGSICDWVRRNFIKLVSSRL